MARKPTSSLSRQHRSQTQWPASPESRKSTVIPNHPSTPYPSGVLKQMFSSYTQRCGVYSISRCASYLNQYQAQDLPLFTPMPYRFFQKFHALSLVLVFPGFPGSCPILALSPSRLFPGSCLLWTLWFCGSGRRRCGSRRAARGLRRVGKVEEAEDSVRGRRLKVRLTAGGAGGTKERERKRVDKRLTVARRALFPWTSASGQWQC
jgi:hypothetical protein